MTFFSTWGVSLEITEKLVGAHLKKLIEAVGKAHSFQTFKRNHQHLIKSDDPERKPEVNSSKNEQAMNTLMTLLKTYKATIHGTEVKSQNAVHKEEASEFTPK